MCSRVKIAIQLFLSIGVVVMFTACNLIDEKLKEFGVNPEDKEKIVDAIMDEFPDLKDEQNFSPSKPTATELNYIKLNDESIDLDISKNDNNNIGVKKNKSVVKSKSSTIEVIEFGFKPNKEGDDVKQFISVILRSPNGGKSLNLTYEMYPLSFFEENIGLQKDIGIQENISIFYEDYKSGYFTSSYASSRKEIESFFKLNSEKLTINVIEMLRYLQETQVDNFDPHMARPPQQDDYDMLTRFFADELYSLQISMAGEIVYDGNIFWELRNCIFLSSDTAPVDADDICKAYLAMY